MYFMFVDESGTPPKRDKAAGQYMVLSGFIVPEGSWQVVSNEFLRIKRKFNVTGEVKWKFFGTGNKKADNSLLHLTRDAVDAFRSELFNLVTSRNSLKIITCVASIEAGYAMPSVYEASDIYHLAYKGLTERFQYFLQDASRTTGQQQYGIVVCDHRMSSDDQKLRAKHHELVERNATYVSKYKNIIETVFFSPSHLSVGVQLADMIAGAVHRSFQYGEHKHAEAIDKAFRRSPSGEVKGYGLVFMPQRTFIMPPGGGE